MAKKRFNVASTLNKNQEASKLPKKIALKKSSKDIETVKQKVDAIHTPSEAPKVSQPEVKAKVETVKPVKVSKPKKEKIVRLTIDTPETLHRKLKIKAINSGKSMREYLLDMVCKDLGVKNSL